MSLEELKESLFLKACEIALSAPNAEWYLFGSCIKTYHLATDIDLLIIYDKADEADQIRKSLDAFAKKHPIHLVLLSDDEESESQFIASTACQKIFPASS
jgi:predicted nucleotidyltransferase